MLPFIPRPGETPRRLEVERKKRIYAAQTIPDLLKKLGVRLEGGAVYLLAGDKEYKFTPESSLEEFDDDSFEERSLEEWIELGSVLTAAGNQTNSAWRESALVIPGKAHVNGEWIEGHAVAYNRQNNQWKFLPHPAEADNPNISADVKTHGIWLHRLHVYFNAEDPFKFAERLAFAHRHRAYTEAKIQFVQKLDDMAVPEAMQMASKQLKNVVNRLGDYTGKFHELTAFPALTAAYRVFHGRVQNELAHPMEVNFISSRNSFLISFVFGSFRLSCRPSHALKGNKRFVVPPTCHHIISRNRKNCFVPIHFTQVMKSII